jgi:hypothetical protein
MIVIALALVLIAAACAAVLMDATRSMLPGVGQPVRPIAVEVPVQVSVQMPAQATGQVPTQRTRAVSPDAIDDAHRAYGFVAALPAESRSTLRTTL